MWEKMTSSMMMKPYYYIVTYRVRYGPKQGDLRYEHCMLTAMTEDAAVDFVREELCAKRGLVFVYAHVELYNEREEQRILKNGYTLEDFRWL